LSATPQSQNTGKNLKLPFRKIAAVLVSSIICVSILFGADLYLHHKHGINLWGYRGPVADRKQPGEKRVAVLGGSTTWGFGLRAGQDFPAQLQHLITADNPKLNVLNLGSNGEGAYSFTQTLTDYDYLDIDLVVLYSGYNDLGAPNYYNFRHRSPIFAATGFLPLLPSLTVDKLSVWKQKLMGANDQPVFSPPHLDQENDSSRLREQLGTLTGKAPQDAKSGSCSPEWQFYCDRISAAADLALGKGKRVLIVGEPYISDPHVAQQHDLANFLNHRYAGRSQLRYVDLGRAVDLRDQSLCWDGMHLTEEGNRRIAAALSEPVRDMLQK
jgi:lysophospholipase L1-like esterase